MSAPRGNWANVQKALADIPGLYLHDQWQHDAMEKLLTSWYDLPPGAHALAENVLADQFVQLADGTVQKVSLESGEFEPVCEKLEQLKAVLTEGPDANYFLATPLRIDWEKAGGRALAATERLVPTTPFIGGGEFAASNLHVAPRDEAIGYLNDFHAQTKNLPDGATVQLKVVP